LGPEAAAIILEAVGEEGSSPLLLWLSNLWSGVVSQTLTGRRVLIVWGKWGIFVVSNLMVPKESGFNEWHYCTWTPRRWSSYHRAETETHKRIV